MTKSRWSYLAIAIFTLAVQVAAAAHSPAVHEEPVSTCRDNGAHFCAETVEHETGPCVLCHVSLNGVFLDPPSSDSRTLQAEPVVAETVQPLDLAPLLSSHAPRGPPVG
jgi:hypothetical protein